MPTRPDWGGHPGWGHWEAAGPSTVDLSYCKYVWTGALQLPATRLPAEIEAMAVPAHQAVLPRAVLLLEHAGKELARQQQGDALPIHLRSAWHTAHKLLHVTGLGPRLWDCGVLQVSSHHISMTVLPSLSLP